MEFSTIHYAVSLIILCINIAMFVAIKFNDLKHLDISMKELKATVKETGGKVDLLAERISKMEGVLSVKSTKRVRNKKYGR